MNYGSLTFPFRRYEIGKVYRGERAQRGRFREFYQADIDVIGDGTLDILNDAEIPSVIYKCLSSLGLEKFVIHINNRKLLSGFFEVLGIDRAATDVMRVVDKLAKIGAAKTRELLVEELGISESTSDELLDLVTLDGDPISYLEQYRGKNEQLDRGMEELAAVARHMSDFGVPDTHFKIDLSIMRGLDYYTGTVYETLLTDHPEVGSICSGGRYDNLAEYYTDKKLPGVGIAIGLTRLFSILQEQSMLNPEVLTAAADILIVPMTDDLSHSVALATSMRELGIRVQIYSENKKLKHKISYADKQKIPFVVFLGQDEIEKDMITIKDMASGDQTTASAGIIAAGLKGKVFAMRSGKPIQG
jgi:histidyl-tRNA synthetase